MAKIERTYNIPLRSTFRNVPAYKKAKKALNAVKVFLAKHMKSDNIKLGNNINRKIWEHGIKNPPHHIKVTAVKDDSGLVKAELFGFSVADVAKKPVKTEKAEAKEEAKAEVVEAKAEKKEEAVAKAEKKEETVEAKAEVKEEKTEEKKPKPKTAKPKAKPE